MIKLLLAMVMSYLLGSIPFGYLSVKWIKGVDVRQHGSGNTGATNALRVGGPGAALLAAVGDVGKGVLAIVIARVLINTPIFGLKVKILLLICSLIVILGHSWSLFLNFQGGKGVATTLGVLIALLPYLIPIILLFWIGIIAFTRYVSLASMIAALLVPVMMTIFHEPGEYIFFGIVVAIFVIYRHRSNIQRLIKGNENKIEWPRRSRSQKAR